MAQLTVVIDKSDIGWLVKALEHTRDMVATGMSERGQDFKQDEAYLKYKALAERFKILEKY
jgi:hypothetical protein